MGWLRVLVLSIAPLPASAAAGAEFPYTAKVVGPRAEAFSGPGRQNYVTDQLAAGQSLEVYRHEPGGWCAIRPPEGSFSWVEARFLAQVPGHDIGILRATADAVPCYIGSRLGPERSTCNVRLRRDELVESLSEESVGGKRWYKITPPAGEFRWIEAAQISQGSEAPDPRPPTPDPRPLTPGLRPEPVDDPRTLRATTSKYVPAENLRPLPSSDDAIADSVRALEVKLSLMMSDDASQWRLDELNRRAETLAERATSTAERETVRAFLSKLARLDAIKNRRHTSRPVETPLSARPALTPPLLADGPNSTETSDDESRYDGIGRLREVVSRDVTAAPFALVDDAERVRAYVSPAPGVNLRAHVGQRVGIYGIQGILAPRGQKHLTAQRIMPLDERTRR
jgi:hypothetical protein